MFIRFISFFVSGKSFVPFDIAKIRRKISKFQTFSSYPSTFVVAHACFCDNPGNTLRNCRKTATFIA